LQLALVSFPQLILPEPAKVVDAPENDRRAHLEAPGQARKRIAQLFAAPIFRAQSVEWDEELRSNLAAPALDVMFRSRNRRYI
jgi:hypothetical protein